MKNVTYYIDFHTFFNIFQNSVKSKNKKVSFKNNKIMTSGKSCL